MAKYNLTNLLKETQKDWDEGVDFKMPEDVAQRLADIGAGFYELTEKDIVDSDVLDYSDYNQVEMMGKYLEKIGDRLDQYPVIYSFYKDDDGDVFFVFSDNSHLDIQDWSKDDINMVINAGQYGRLDEDWDDGIDLTFAEDVATAIANEGGAYYQFSEEDYDDIDNDIMYSGLSDHLSAEKKLKEISTKLPQYPFIYTFFRDAQDTLFLIFSDRDYIGEDEVDWNDDDWDMIKQAGKYGRLDEDQDRQMRIQDRVDGEIDMIVNQGLKYVEVPQEILDDIDGSFESDETDISYAMDEIGKFIDKTNKERGVGKKYGETDEDYDGESFTIIDWADDFPSADEYLWDGFGWLMVFDDDFEDIGPLNPQQLQDIIDAGNFQVSENEEDTGEEDDEYDPDFEDLSEYLKDALEELGEEIANNVDAWDSGDLRDSDYGPDGFKWTAPALKDYDKTMPTDESQKKMEDALDHSYEEAHESAVEDMGDSGDSDVVDVWEEFGGDPEVLTQKALEEAEKAYREAGDEEAADKYQTAYDTLQEYTDERAREDGQGVLYYGAAIEFFPIGDDNSLLSQPTVRIRVSVGDEYSDYAAKEFDLAFNSEEELEEELPKLAQEAEDWIDGTTRRRAARKEWEAKNNIKEAYDFESDKDYAKLMEDLKARFEKWALSSFESEFTENTDYGTFTNEIRLREQVQNSRYNDLMDYWSGRKSLPEEAQAAVDGLAEQVEKSAKEEVIENFEDYFPEYAAEFYDVEEEIVEDPEQLMDSGDERLEELGLSIRDRLNDKFNQYVDETGVRNYLNSYTNQGDDSVTIKGMIAVDPEYSDQEFRKIIKVPLGELDKYEEYLQQMLDWMTGK